VPTAARTSNPPHTVRHPDCGRDHGRRQRSAPTPTAAAEMAVPVRAELAARLAEIRARMMRAAQGGNQRRRQRLADLGRALGRPQALTDPARQRFDLFAERLEPALRGFVRARRDRLNALPLSLSALRTMLRSRRDALQGQGQRLPLCLERLSRRRTERLAELGSRLERARARMLADAARQTARDRDMLERMAARLAAAAARMLPPRREALERLDRLRQTLGYRETLRRGFAVVHGPAGLLTEAAEAAQAPRFEIEFLDGRLAARPDAPPAKPARKPREPRGQKSLF